MMAQNFYHHMAIPEKCLLSKPIFKRLFQEHGNLNITDKKALKDDIGKIRWVYALKPATLNIATYRDDEREYDEIAIMQIELTSAARMARIAAFVNKAIPYPLVLVFCFADTIAVSVADKRINQADKSKWVVENAWTTPWFNPDAPNKAQQKFMQDMAIQNLSFVDFYAFYSDVRNRIIALNAADRGGSYQLASGDKAVNRAEALRELGQLEQEKQELENKLAKERQMGRQVDMTTRMKELADRINALKENL